ncbi:MAG: bifunctional ADP-heptose synthase [Bacteroidales bacterium]|nr:bifunctional ADP-heptose synthase [Bacteroidales bacterium]
MIFTEEEIRHLFNKFNTCRVLVIGDVMIDSYLVGKVDRISPEAPVPVVALKQRDNMLGGAANVALNIRSLGAEAILCSVIGNDKQGDVLLDLMKKEGLKTNGIIRSSERITTTKFRIIGNRMQMLRVDEEIDTDLDENDSTNLIKCISDLITEQKPDVIILQDYNKGVLSPEVIERVAEIASGKGIPVAVDPKKKNFTAYKGITLFKPNLKEIVEGLKIDVDPMSIESLDKAAGTLHKSQNIELVMITLSEHGIFISVKDSNGTSSKIIPAEMRSIADVSGAGDTVISVAALCLAAKTDHFLMAALSNLAGGLVCEQAGVVPVDKFRLMAEATVEL